MKQIKNEVLAAMNLSSYSSSPGFVGYFERTGRYANGMAERAVACLFEAFDLGCNNWALVSSLHANVDEVGSFGDAAADSADLKTVESLYSSNLLPRFSYRARFGTSYESESYVTAVNKSLQNFIETPAESLSQKVLKNLLVARMIVYGLRGHLFLASEEKGVVLYPHDDTGFGVVVFGTNPDKDDAINFISRGGALNGFRSFLVD